MCQTTTRYQNPKGLYHMWQAFSVRESVLTFVVQYLTVREMVKCRQISRLSNGDIHGWRNKALQIKHVVACDKCPALRHVKNTEHCPLCESTTCVEHLEKCTNCGDIYCSFCVGFCCLEIQ